MSGGTFSSDWLSLREPVDHGSVNAELRRQLVDAIGAPEKLTVVDLGSGTGSNLRGLAPWLPGPQAWRLLDHDQALLNAAEAAQKPDTVTMATGHCVDLNTLDLNEMFRGADLITAAAFFDIASQSIIEKVARAVANANAAFYTVLNYDGLAAWFPEHEANGEMRRLFNAHQQSDKGMGTALGPDATEALRQAFDARGYRVATGPSPWVVGAQHQDMRAMLDDGWAAAVQETGQLNVNVLTSWQRQRHSAPNAITVVGHQDLLALPPR